MDDITKRLAELSSEQRELLELRLRKRGLQSHLSAGGSTVVEAGLPEALALDSNEVDDAGRRGRSSGK
jgi:hypothetical protein